MSFRYVSILAKLNVFVLLTGLIPLIFFGAYAIKSSEKTSYETIEVANQGLALQIAGRITQYLDNTLFTLRTLSENLPSNKNEDLNSFLRTYALNFKEFHFLKIMDAEGQLLFTSEVIPKESEIMDHKLFVKSLHGDLVVSDVYMTKNFIPALSLYFPIRHLGKVNQILLVELDLLFFWNLVEELKIGEKGFASILTKDYFLFATGEEENKVSALNMRKYNSAQQINDKNKEVFIRESNNRKYLVVFHQLPQPFSWIIVVEQPVEEAYILAYAMEKDLIFVLGIFFVTVILAGIIFGRRVFLNPIDTLIGRASAIGKGDWEGRVNLEGNDEFSQLAKTMNQMSEQISYTQNELLKKEREALLGKIAAGLAHDLKHPITSIENYVRLLQYKYDDSKFRELFLNTSERELRRVHEFLGNLKDLSQEMNLQKVQTSLSNVLQDCLDNIMPELVEKNISVETEFDQSISLKLDPFYFSRAIQNLIRNAYEALHERGVLKINLIKTTYLDKERVHIMIEDNGVGMSPEQVAKIYDEFRTTKRGGLGLGLAITRKIIREHGGDIQVKSSLGHGTCFTISFITE